MGIDWEEILDAEGADMAGAYGDSLPEENCRTTSHYVSGAKFEDDFINSFIEETMNDFDDTLIAWGFYDKDAWVGEPSYADPSWKLESKTNDELIEECIKFSQEVKHVKCVLKDAGQDIDTLFDYLDSRALCDEYVSAEDREADRRCIESKLKYEEESMCDDELREKCRAMTRDELMDKHINIEGIKDAAEYILLFIEEVIQTLRTDWCCEFEGKQDLKDLMEKYKESLPETREMAEKIAEERAARANAAKERENADREKEVKENTDREKQKWDKIMAIYDAEMQARKIEKYGSIPDEFCEEDELPMYEDLIKLLKEKFCECKEDELPMYKDLIKLLEEKMSH